ncbi:MAG: hypothetical protein V7K89_33485, partial [Nostoc sp.]
MTEQSLNDPNSHFQGRSTQAGRALEKEANLPLTGWQQEVSTGLELGLEAAESCDLNYILTKRTGHTSQSTRTTYRFLATFGDL